MARPFAVRIAFCRKYHRNVEYHSGTITFVSIYLNLIGNDNAVRTKMIRPAAPKGVVHKQHLFALHSYHVEASRAFQPDVHRTDDTRAVLLFGYLSRVPVPSKESFEFNTDTTAFTFLGTSSRPKEVEVSPASSSALWPLEPKEVWRTPSMEKYRLVREHKSEEADDRMTSSSSVLGDIPEVRITQQGKPRAYISFGMNLFVGRLVVTPEAS